MSQTFVSDISSRLDGIRAEGLYKTERSDRDTSAWGGIVGKRRGRDQPLRQQLSRLVRQCRYRRGGAGRAG